MKTTTQQIGNTKLKSNQTRMVTIGYKKGSISKPRTQINTSSLHIRRHRCLTSGAHDGVTAAIAA